MSFRLTCVLLAFALSSCQYIETVGGRNIVVEIRDASGLHGGESVYMAGVRIGSVGTPQLVNGSASIPVTLFRGHKNAITPGTVFLVDSDPDTAGRPALTATNCSSADKQKGPDVFTGVRTKLAFIAVCGATKAKDLLKYLER